MKYFITKTNLSLVKQDMGVNGLKSFLEKRTESFQTDLPISMLGGESIAVDLFNVLYGMKDVVLKKAVNRKRFRFGDDGWSDLDLDTLRITLGSTFRNYLQKFIRSGVNMILCIESKSEDKEGEIERRRRRKRAIYENMMEAKHDRSKLDKYKQTLSSLLYLERNELDFCITIANSLSCTILYTESEAEALAADLCKSGEVYAVISSDSDLFAHNCPMIINGVRGKNVSIIVMANVLCSIFNEITTDLEFTGELLTVLCSLSGNDYSGKHRVNAEKTYFRMLEMIEEDGYNKDRLLSYSRKARKAYSLFTEETSYTVVKIDGIQITPRVQEINREERERMVMRMANHSLPVILEDHTVLNDIFDDLAALLRELPWFIIKVLWATGALDPNFIHLIVYKSMKEEDNFHLTLLENVEDHIDLLFKKVVRDCKPRYIRELLSFFGEDYMEIVDKELVRSGRHIGLGESF